MSSGQQADHDELVVFSLDGLRLALFLPIVERVVRAVEVTPLPQAPEIVLGVINAWGRVVPVVQPRRRLGLPERPVEPDDRFLIARTSRRLIALVADSVDGISQVEHQRARAAEQGLAFAPYLHGVARLPEGLVLIYDLDRFLSLDEELRLDAALSAGR